jgi:hypothetical protein
MPLICFRRPAKVTVKGAYLSQIPTWDMKACFSHWHYSIADWGFRIGS